MHALINEIYKTGLVRDEHGTAYKLHSEIDSYEGELLYSLIDEDRSICKTLEIGCGYGLSTLHICAALAGRDSASHIIIDPFQTRDWHGIGVHNLRRMQFDAFKCIETPSEFILPQLAQNQAGAYDFVLIDGLHTFDQVMVDFFYANRLVRVGGYVVLDDCNMASISRAVAYIDKYPCYQILSQYGRNLYKKSTMRQIGRIVRSIFPPSVMSYLLPKKLYDRYYGRIAYPSMVVFRKIAEDKRGWNWFIPF